jgi:WD40 repeat protein
VELFVRLRTMEDLGASRVSFRVAFGRKLSQFGIVVWSPDGGWVAAAGHSDRPEGRLGDGLIRLWRPDSGEALILEGHTAAVAHIAWSPDSCTLASGSWDYTVRLWDLASRRERHALLGHSGAV